MTVLPRPDVAEASDPAPSGTALARGETDGPARPFTSRVRVPPVRAASERPERAGPVWHALIGAHTHRVIARVLAAAPGGDALTAAVLEATFEEVRADKRLGNVANARVRVASAAATYLRHLRPLAPAHYEGAEQTVDGGRVDLVWRCPRLGVFYDEIKSTRTRLVALDEPAIDQVERYLRAGVAAYGDGFAGLRLLLLGNRNACMWLTPGGDRLSLADSPAAVTALREDGQPWPRG